MDRDPRRSRGLLSHDGVARFVTKQHSYVAARDDTRHHYGIFTVKPGREIAYEVYGFVDNDADVELVDRFSLYLA